MSLPLARGNGGLPHLSRLRGGRLFGFLAVAGEKIRVRGRVGGRWGGVGTGLFPETLNVFGKDADLNHTPKGKKGRGEKVLPNVARYARSDHLVNPAQLELKGFQRSRTIRVNSRKAATGP